MLVDMVDVVTNPDTGEEVAFIPEAAVTYAGEKKYRLPKKMKDADTLISIVEENVKDWYEKAGIPLEEAYECERCKHIVLEPDTYCWYCGHDVSNEGDGGFHPAGQAKPVEQEEEEKEEIVEEEEPEAQEAAQEEDDKTYEGESENEEAPAEEDAEEAIEAESSESSDSDEPEEVFESSPPPGSGDELPAVTEEPKAEILPPEPPARKERDTGTLDILMMDHEPRPENLTGYTARIRSLNANAGASAFKIGKYLIDIEEKRLFTTGGYETLEAYASAELDINSKNCKNFKKFALAFDAKIAEALGVYKMELVCRAPEIVRQKFLKAALPKSEGGSGMSRDDLEKKLREEKKRLKVESTRGRKPDPFSKTKLYSLDGTTISVKIKSGGETEELIPETNMKMVLKWNKSGTLDISFVKLPLTD